MREITWKPKPIVEYPFHIHIFFFGATIIANGRRYSIGWWLPKEKILAYLKGD